MGWVGREGGGRGKRAPLRSLRPRMESAAWVRAFVLRCGGARLLARVRLLSRVRPSLQPKHAVVDHVLLPPLYPSALSLSTSQDITCLFQKEGQKNILLSDLISAN